MKRVLFILFGLMAVSTAIGVMIASTRPIKWPANIDQKTEEEVAA